MGKTKKPFIDKKNSSTYHILYRSQRDVAGADNEDGGEASGVILWPSPDNNKDTDQKVLIGASSDDTKDATQTQLSQAGLVDDYDYDKHMKPVTGTGKLLDAGKNKNTKAMVQARSHSIQEDTINEVERQLDSIALTAECMDDDIAQALFGDFDAEDFEELNDEFIFDAAQEPDKEDGGDQAFDFAAHVKTLMEKARMEASGEGGQLGTIHEQGRQDQDFFSKAKPIGDDEDQDYFDENDYLIEGTPGVVAKLGAAAEKALCDKFNETLAEYDSDEIGECYEEEIVGSRPLEGDALVEAYLDDYLQEKDDDIFMQGARHYMEGNDYAKGGSGFSALVGTKMIPVKELDKLELSYTVAAVHGDIRPLADVLGDAEGLLTNPRAAPPAEEIFIDGKSYFSEKMRNPWDCESILSTYSNLDNNPVTIGAGGRRRQRKPQKNKKDDSSVIDEEEEMQQILLSDKTGLPLGVLPTREQAGGGGEETYVSVNKGEARKKSESMEEKKVRKVNIKKERQVARMQKKMMKEAFNEEFSKRAQDVLTDDVGGKSVFRF
jgi:protein LTV1